MAGNIVKWWKHKILGGYKQFSVQECTTDSEELMYHQVRASSSCSAPPDLLLVSDRENNIPLRSPVVNIITTPPGNATNTTTTSLGSSGGGSGQCTERKHITGQQHSAGHGTKELGNGSGAGGISKHLRISSNRNSSKYAQQQQQQQQGEEDVVDAPSQQQQHSQSQQRQHHSSKEERIRLEEFTCDVSVEGGKSSQPLQFSFTFYDLDGHHGKITKDDIVGIVYTIYESIGKSVVVPHCGSKTINVRLTVSPEGKSKAHAASAACNKLKKLTGTSAVGGGGAGGGILEHAMSKAATTSGAHASRQRQHRYRPRKLIKSDDEDDDSNSEKEKDIVGGNEAVACGVIGKGNKSHVSSKYNKMKMEQTQSQCCQPHSHSHPHSHPDMSTTTAAASVGVGGHCQLENPYENMMNLKCYSKADGAEECRGGVSYAQRPTTTDIYMKQASNRVKMLRRARKQKYQDHCNETRQRSLSVGNESCWKNRHLQAQQQHQQHLSKLPQQQQQQEIAIVDDVVDGVQLRKPNASAKLLAQKRNSAECWKTALNRNDLISIIRESMEKNRLCFQLNGKPQANVSPIRQSQNQQHHQQQQQQQQHQRQRSNTVSKIPTLIANHNNTITPTNNFSTTTTTTTILQANLNHSSSNNNNNSNNNYSHIELSIHDQHNNSNSSSSNNSLQYQHHHHQQQQQQQPQQQQQQHHHSHPQPHIPIYHQQLAINPAVLAAQNSASAHNKMNLCGYDSFLHATICGGSTSHSPPPPPSATTTPQLLNNGPATTPPTYCTQPIATVQPIITVPNQHQKQQQQHHQKSHKSGTKLQRSGSSSTPTNQGQGGYQRLTASQHQAANHQSATRHNLAALNSKNPSLEKSQVEQLEKWLHAGRDKNCQKTSKEVKNYGNLIYAKLSEQLQAKERRMRHKHQQQQQQPLQQQQHRENQYQKQQETQQQNTLSSTSSSSNGGVGSGDHGSTKLHYIGDAIECENLLGQTTTDDEETNNLSNSNKIATNQTTDETKTKVQTKPKVVTDTLIDFRDDDEDDDDDDDDEGVEANEANVVEAHVSLPAAADARSANIDEDNVAVALEVEVDDDDEEVGVDEFALAGGNNIAAMTANTSTSSSLVHRYVHEHIHHHYHHFKEKNEA